MKPNNETNEKLELLGRFVQNTDTHIFLTGKAGTGKTTFLRNLAHNINKRMIVVAPTGVAAINAGGVTIHSFFQLPFGPIVPNTSQGGSSAHLNAQKISRTKLKIMRSLDLLVIDEVSMVRADLLDAIDSVLRKIRRSSVPFGGVQLLMIGDIQQLSPVAKPEEWELLSPYYKSVYFFDSIVLKNTPYICVELQHIYRQNDMAFINILNQIRNNNIDSQSLDLLNSRYIPGFKADDKDEYITLTTHNYQADEINEKKLAAIKSKTLSFDAEVEGIFPENAYPTKEHLELKVGAQVMFVKNDPSPDKLFYNGKIGTIVSYNDDEGLTVQCDGHIIIVSALKWQNFEYKINEETQEIEEKEIGSFTQIPLKTAWAITIHKSQGLTFKKVILNAELAFAHGQVYVALSRCTSLEGLVLSNKISRNVIFNDNTIDAFVKKIPSLEPDNERLVEEELAFVKKKIIELFDFDELSILTNRLAKTIRENENIFEKETVDIVNIKRNSFRNDIVDVSLKFARQIEGIFDRKEIDHDFLQERIKKASLYFFEKLNELEVVIESVSETDNKAVNEAVKAVLDLMKEILYVKTACLDMTKNGFELEKYLEMNNKKTIEAENLKSRKLKQKKVRKEDESLMDALLKWRDEKSFETGSSENNILPKSVMLRIVEKKPVSIRELKSISKLGATRIKAFGAEIINIVLNYMGLGEQTFEDNDSLEELKLSNTALQSKRLFDEGLDIEGVAKERSLAKSTIEGHLVEIIKNGFYDASDYISKEHYETIKDYFSEVEDSSFSAAREVLGHEYSYFEIKLVRSLMEND